MAEAVDYFLIQNLLNRYSDAVDRGDFDSVGEMFRDADVYFPGDAEPTDAVVDDAHESFGLTVAQRFDVEIEAATRPAELEPSAPAETASETPAPLDAQVDRDEVPTISPVDVASLVNDPPTPPWSRPSPLTGRCCRSTSLSGPSTTATRNRASASPPDE